MLKHLLRARHFYPNAPRRQKAVQAVAYAKAVEYLGEKWILAKKYARITDRDETKVAFSSQSV